MELNKLLPLGERDWIDGLHHIVPPTFEFPEGGGGIFTEGTFYPAFLTDLRHCDKSVVILSPYATSKGTSRWVEILRDALARRVRIRILTKPPGEAAGMEDAAEIARELRELGMVVDFRAHMHEKIAILDGRILWHGSLNILSHNDTHESMLRIESPIACERIARFITPDGQLGFDARENPNCQKCGSPTVWNNGRHGVWFTCVRKPTCDFRVNARGLRRQAVH